MKKLKREIKWVSVLDSMPLDNEECLFTYGNLSEEPSVIVAYGWRKNGKWYSDFFDGQDSYFDEVNSEVLYWAKLPLPPMKVKKYDGPAYIVNVGLSPTP